MNDGADLRTIGPEFDNSGDDLSTDDPSVRALYTGDISTSIQERFTALIVERYSDRMCFPDFNYFSVRNSDSTYTLYCGDIDVDGKINDADVYQYQQVSAGGYSTAWTWSESHASNGRVDLSGYSGYIYSSYEDYQPLRGFPQAKIDSQSHMLLTFILMFAVIVALGSLIKGWFNVKEK